MSIYRTTGPLVSFQGKGKLDCPDIKVCLFLFLFRVKEVRGKGK